METVSFFSYSGVPLVADLYLPDPEPPRSGYPTIVACVGWGSVKELMASWGRALAAAGYAVLIPDYSGFGSSSGTRGECFPAVHVDDVRATLTYAGERIGLDGGRLAVMGVSYGGAIAVAVGGLDDRPAAIVSIVGYGSGERHLQSVRSPEQWTQFRERLKADRVSRVLTGRSEAIDPDVILLRDEAARAWRARVEEQYPHMAFRTTLESADRLIEFQPERSLPYSPPTPILLIHAENDTMVSVDESRAMWKRAAEPRHLVVIPGIDHHDVHTGEAFRQVIDNVDDWLQLHLVRDHGDE